MLPEGSDNVGKVKLFLLPSPVHPISGLFAASMLDPWASTKALSSVDEYLIQCFPRAPRPWPRGTGASSQATSESTAEIEVCVTISKARVVKTPPGSHGIWCW